jgi:SEC-C motif
LPLAAVIYLALLPLWWLCVDGLAFVAAHAADIIYHFFDPLVTINPSGKVINVIVKAPDESLFAGQSHSSALRMDTITYGLPMLVALVFVTRADSLRARARALALGLVAMVLISVPAVMIWAKMTSLQLDDGMAAGSISGPENRSGFFYYVFHGYAFSQPVVATVVWMALLMLGLFKEKAKVQVAAPAGRNAPCPCGSGRKYKRCCGLK